MKRAHQGSRVIRLYVMILLLIAANAVLWFLWPDKARLSLNATGSVFREMLMILPPMLLLVGMLDQWVPKKTIETYVGRGAGAKGMLFSLLLGSAMVGPLYAGFPLAAMLLQKGARIANVVAFLTVKAAAEVPLVIMESRFVGLQFALLRLGLTFIAAVLIGWIAEKAIQGSLDCGKLEGQAVEGEVAEGEDVEDQAVEGEVAG